MTQEIEAAIADAAHAIANGLAKMAAGAEDARSAASEAEQAVKTARSKAARLGPRRLVRSPGTALGRTYSMTWSGRLG